MSSTRATEPPFSIGWKVRLSVRPSCFWIVKLVLSAPARRCLEIGGETIALRAQDRAGSNAIAHKVARGLALAIDRREIEQLDQPVIDHHHAVFRVEHAQAGGHVVERGVEAPGQQCQIAAGDDRIEQRPAQPVGDEAKRHEERQEAQPANTT